LDIFKEQFNTDASFSGLSPLQLSKKSFTEQGVAMLSGVLNSPRAVKVNVEIMRAFVRLRKLLATHTDLARKLTALEQKYDEQFKVVFDAIRALMAPPEKPCKKIGFEVKEKRAAYGRRGEKHKRKTSKARNK